METCLCIYVAGTDVQVHGHDIICIVLTMSSELTKDAD